MINKFSRVQPGDEIITEGGQKVKILKTIKTATKSITIAFHKLEDGSTLLLHYDLNGNVTRKFHPSFKETPNEEQFQFSQRVEKSFLTKVKEFFTI